MPKPTAAAPMPSLLEILLNPATIGTAQLPSGSTTSARAAAGRRRSIAIAVEAILAGP